ncbi:MAG: S1 RNA-binding domain-containing protein [Chloroflexi bacterium]|nr:S1 RNA-binding domain-containing protein [Chloroflexota bacterium]
MSTNVADYDFEAMLEETFREEPLERGDIVTGTVLMKDHQGLLVDIGMKMDGVVPKQDLDRLHTDVDFEVGDEVMVMISRLEDSDGNLLVSVSQALQVEDWLQAEKLMEDADTWEGTVAEANRGGLIMPFGNLRGFVPASHVIDLPRGLTEDERQDQLQSFVGKPITVKIIEVNRKRRRLVLSQREAMREHRAEIKEKFLDELQEGEVRKGIVSGLRDFGAFVDLGGADGLIHISELAWHRVHHPREIVNIGDNVEVYILSLDEEGKRIGLSLKRLQPNPWSEVDDLYHIGQLVLGEVTRVTQFGVFVRLEPGIEALLHSSQVGNPTVELEHYVRQGQHLLLRIISIEADRQRLGLSLKEVTEAERDNFAIEHGYEVDDITFYVPPYEAEDEEDDGGDDDDAVVESQTEEATV